MATIPEMIKDGKMCSICGTCFTEPHGHEVVCGTCWDDMLPQERGEHTLATNHEFDNHQITE